MGNCRMTTTEKTVWGMHAGRVSEADSLFLKKKYLGIGGKELGGLEGLPSNRDSFKTRYQEVFTATKQRAVAIQAGQLFRFLHEMKEADIIVYPSKRDRQVHIGKISGSYIFDPVIGGDYSHLRPVNWEKKVPRTNFTQGALYEIGSAMTLFQIKNYAEEFISALEGTTLVPAVDEDETVALVAEDIEETTRDFIIKRLTQELKGHPFAEFVAHLINAMGYRTRVSAPGPDGGIDIIAHKDELGFEPPIIKVQVKSGEGGIGAPQVQALFGTVA